MIFYIVWGHFGQFATTNEILLKLTKQHNMVVGSFFVLSGFLLALTTSLKSGRLEQRMSRFFRRRMARIYPVYFVVILLFAPMFIAIERFYGNSWDAIFGHAIVVLSLLQAWWPDWGLWWNSPTWFLSSLMFCYLGFPLFYRWLSTLTAKQRWWTLGWLLLAGLGSRVPYSFWTGWSMLEGYGELPREQIWIFNFFRFHPVLNAMEFFSGAVLGSVVAEKTDADTTPVVGSNPLIHQTSLLMFACLSCILIRTLIPLNDLLFRSLIFFFFFCCGCVALSCNLQIFCPGGLDMPVLSIWER